MKDFRGKVAAITGAGSGIGRALALELADRGCNLALTDINAGSVDETATDARSRGVKVTSGVLDVAKREDVYAWADAVVRDHGVVNLIFNNAGVAVGATVEGIEYADFEWLMNINFWGVVYGTKAFLPHLKASGDGHIINISSVFGIIAAPTQAAYNASKFAVRGFTESLRLELELQHCGVSATSIHPGGIKTNIANTARMNDSVASIGANPSNAREKLAAGFITTPRKAALQILRAVEKDARRGLIGPDAVFIDLAQRVLPASYQGLVKSALKRLM